MRRTRTKSGRFPARQKGYYAYVRTSTVKQGIEGVSLEVQEAQARSFARQRGLEIKRVFVEMETAAKQGRPLFTQMMQELRSEQAEGLILHKVDRGARTLREWSDITDLTDLGIPVLFVHDSSLDITTRGGRLQGDIQAVIAADYIRNLREESIKGLVGRLKQGIWPFNAPLGYINNGKGKTKTIDPVAGSLVRQAFELYGSGQYTVKALRTNLQVLGLRTSTGAALSKSTFTSIFRNPFYYGALVFRSTGEVYPGLHEALIDRALFDRVQMVLDGRNWKSGARHRFTYRGDIKCASCGYAVLGERQKGNVYYRCHSKQCAGTSFREEHVTHSMQQDLELVRRFSERHPELEACLREAMKSTRVEEKDLLQAHLLQKAKLEERMSALVDAYIDGVLDKDAFSQKRNRLQEDGVEINQAILRCERGEHPGSSHAAFYLELVDGLRDKAFRESAVEARQLCKPVTSNFMATGKVVVLQWTYQFRCVIEHEKANGCAHPRDRARTTVHFFNVFMQPTNIPTSPCPQRRPHSRRRTCS